MIENGKIKSKCWRVSSEIVERFNESDYSKKYTIKEYPPMGIRASVFMCIVNKTDENEIYTLNLCYKDGYVAYDLEHFDHINNPNGLNTPTEYLPCDYEEIIKLFKGNGKQFCE